MSVGTAFRAFFAALFNPQVAAELKLTLDHPPKTPSLPEPLPATNPAAVRQAAGNAPARSDAITLLSTLQREARFVDLVNEDLSIYSDAQIGAAARPCLSACAATLQRMLELTPIADVLEGQLLELPAGATAARYQWIGEGSSKTGKVVHPGWRASRMDLPQWTGTAEDVLVIAPVQLSRS